MADNKILKERIFNAETKTLGGNPYKRVNKNSNALGKYQILEKYLPKGVTRDQFLNSPDLQESIMDKHLERLNKSALKIKNTQGYSPEDLMVMMHFQGPTGVRQYLAGTRKGDATKINPSMKEYLKRSQPTPHYTVVGTTPHTSLPAPGTPISTPSDTSAYGSPPQMGFGGFLEDVGKLAVNTIAAPLEGVSGQNFVNFNYNDSGFADAAAASEGVIKGATDVAGTALLGPAYGGIKMGASAVGSGVAGAAGGTQQQRGASNTANTIGSTVQGLGSMASNFVTPGASAKSFGATGFGKAATQAGQGFGMGGGFNPMDMLKVGQGQNTFAHGGTTDSVQVNVEGDNRQEGTKYQMNKSELLVNPQTSEVVENFVTRPPHPADGIDARGTVSATPGLVVISKKYAPEYLEGSLAKKKELINMITQNQKIRENKEADSLLEGTTAASDIVAKGGAYLKQTYGKGGKIHIMPRHRKTVAKLAKNAGVDSEDYMAGVMHMMMGGYLGPINNVPIQKAQFGMRIPQEILPGEDDYAPTLPGVGNADYSGFSLGDIIKNTGGDPSSLSTAEFDTYRKYYPGAAEGGGYGTTPSEATSVTEPYSPTGGGSKSPTEVSLGGNPDLSRQYNWNFSGNKYNSGNTTTASGNGSGGNNPLYMATQLGPGLFNLGRGLLEPAEQSTPETSASIGYQDGEFNRRPFVTGAAASDRGIRNLRASTGGAGTNAARIANRTAFAGAESDAWNQFYNNQMARRSSVDAANQANRQFNIRHGYGVEQDNAANRAAKTGYVSQGLSDIQQAAAQMNNDEAGLSFIDAAYGPDMSPQTKANIERQRNKLRLNYFRRKR